MNRRSANEVQQIPLTNFDARIVQQRVEDDGATERRVLVIESQMPARSRNFEVSSQEFENSRWVMDRLGAEAIVYPGSDAESLGWRRGALQWSSQGEHLGWRANNGDLLLIPEAAYAAVLAMATTQNEEFSMTLPTLHRRLYEGGYLASTDTSRGRLVVRHQIAGTRRAVLHLHGDRVLGDDRDGETSVASGA